MRKADLAGEGGRPSYEWAAWGIVEIAFGTVPRKCLLKGRAASGGAANAGKRRTTRHRAGVLESARKASQAPTRELPDGG